MTNPFRTAVQTHQTLIGAWVETGSPDIAELLVKYGWKTVVIDGEHGPGSLEDWIHIARAITAAGGTPILRLPDGDDTMIKRALDRGFKNFIVPMVNSRADAERVVSAFYYPPRGHRGYAAPIVRGSDWGAKPDYARVTSNDELVIMIQCEHIDAVAQIDDICAVDGIDMIFIGPNDLAASAGHLEQMEHPDVAAMLARIEQVAEKHKMPLGTVRGPGRDWKQLAELGYRLIVGVNDVSILTQGAKTSLDDALSQI